MKCQQRKKRRNPRVLKAFAVVQSQIGIYCAHAQVLQIAAAEGDPVEKQKRIAEVIVSAASNTPDKILARLKQGAA